MRFSFLALMGGLGGLTACGDDTDRPCSAGSPGCVGDGDADADIDGDGDSDTDADADADADLCGDRDGDGHSSARCPDGQGDDCDDTAADVHPGADEVCNGMDDNCTGGADEAMLAAGTDVQIATDGVPSLISLSPGAGLFGLLVVVSDDIYCQGSRLDFMELGADGTVASGPIRISDTPECRYDHTLAVAATPTGWVLAWADAPLPHVAQGVDGFIQVATLSGGVLTGPIDLGDPSSRRDFTPAVAVSPADGALVVWNHQGRDVQELQFAIVDLDGLGGGEVQTLAQPVALLEGRPSVAWTGEVFVIASEANGMATLFVVAPDGTVEDTVEVSRMDPWRPPVLAWDQFEVGYSLLLGGAQQFVQLDARGTGATAPVTIGAQGKALRMSGWARSFALVAVVDAALQTLRGVPTFWNASPAGVESNEIMMDDSGSQQASSPWVVPAESAGRWAVAWIDDANEVRLDFVGCPE